MAGKRIGNNFSGINPIETAKNVGGFMADEFKKGVIDDIGKPMVDDFFSQLFGTGETSSDKAKSSPKSGTLKPGESLSLKDMKAGKSAEKSRNLNITPGIDYRSEIVHGRERVSMKEKQDIMRLVEDIKSELKNLMAAAKELQKEASHETMIATPQSVGKYHVNFFEWLLITIRQARAKVEDGSAWMQAMNGKSKKKGSGYWGMFKKHGTSFGMSHERNVATQTG